MFWNNRSHVNIKTSDLNLMTVFLFVEVTCHTMAMGNLNKSKETTQTATTALKVAP